MKEHLPWIVPIIIALLGALWMIERTMIENGPERVSVLEHKVEDLEYEVNILRERMRQGLPK